MESTLTGFSVYLLSAPARALYFAGYEFVKDIGQDYKQHKYLFESIAGPFAQLLGSVLWVPMDVIKERLQTQAVVETQITSKKIIIPYKNPLDCLIRIIKSEGLSGIYRGFFFIVLYGYHLMLYFFQSMNI